MTYYTDKAIKVANFVLRNADGSDFSKEIQAIESALYEARQIGAQEGAQRASVDLILVLEEIIDRSNNGDLGTSKVNDMRNIALRAISKARGE